MTHTTNSRFTGRSQSTELAELGDSVSALGLKGIRFTSAVVSGLDRGHEIHRLRGRGDRRSGRIEPSDKMALQCFQRAGSIEPYRHGRDRDRASTGRRCQVSKGCFGGIAGSAGDIYRHCKLPVHGSRDRAQPWRIPGTFSCARQFLLKDIVLLAAAVFLIGDALQRIARDN